MQSSPSCLRSRSGVFGWADLRVAVATVLLLAAAACTGPGPDQVVVHSPQGDVAVDVELALTHKEQSRGLMWRSDLGPTAGMLFVFPDARRRSFWMRNTPLSLDIIFIGSDFRIISIAESTAPYSDTSVPSAGPARYVLEVNAGFSDRHGLAPGQSVALPSAALPPAQAAP